MRNAWTTISLTDSDSLERVVRQSPFPERGQTPFSHSNACVKQLTSALLADPSAGEWKESGRIKRQPAPLNESISFSLQFSGKPLNKLHGVYVPK